MEGSLAAAFEGPDGARTLAEACASGLPFLATADAAALDMVEARIPHQRAIAEDPKRAISIRHWTCPQRPIS